MIRKRELRVKEIEENLVKIVEAIEIVENNLSEDFDSFFNSGLIKEGIYKKIEFAIESIIDICNIINADLRLGMPSFEDNIIDNIDKNKVFDRKIIDLIREVKRFRNILVHKYGDIDDKKAFENIHEGLKDFEKIIAEIEKFLEKHRKKKKNK